MPRRKTRKAAPVQKASPRVRTEIPAAGVYYPHRARAYLLADIRPRHGVTTMVIGRDRDSDVRIIEDITVSGAHAVLESFGDGDTWIRAAEKARNGIYIDGARISQPIKLTVGMEIWLGRSRLIATDTNGSFPIAATTISELCRRSVDLYGNQVAAGEHLGRGKDFIRRQFLPRSQRYSKIKPKKPGDKE